MYRQARLGNQRKKTRLLNERSSSPTARPSPFPSNGLDLMIEAVIIIGAVVVLAVTKSKKGKSFS